MLELEAPLTAGRTIALGGEAERQFSFGDLPTLSLNGWAHPLGGQHCAEQENPSSASFQRSSELDEDAKSD
jgi:hypothetical protein